MKAIVFEGTEKVVTKDIPMPEVPEGSTLIRVSHAGICGSDITIYTGYHPRAKAPLVMGHEFSGYIASENPQFAMGELVSVYPYVGCQKCAPCERGEEHTCASLRLIGIDRDGGMAEYVSVPNKYIRALPKGISPELAAFVEPIGVAAHAIRRSEYKGGDSVLLIGAGPIGLAIAITLSAFGADPIICETNEDRLAIATSLGFKCINGTASIEEKLAPTGGEGYDNIFDCAGVQAVAETLPDLIRVGGRITIVAGYKKPPTMNFQKGMMREFEIRFVRNCTRKDFDIAAKLAATEPKYKVLVNNILPPEKAEEGYRAMLTPGKAVKTMFCFE
ncbi:MAG: alcohol dehydrogenase catalytic domain-containing protein [Clostridia bacterium]|nr:alcohol dehydrogenase catalytic domain-containing protein [Clostridia bacterium]